MDWFFFGRLGTNFFFRDMQIRLTPSYTWLSNDCLKAEHSVNVSREDQSEPLVLCAFFQRNPALLTTDPRSFLVVFRLPFGWLWSSLHKKQVWLHGFWQLAEGGPAQPEKVTSSVAPAVCHKEGLLIPHCCFSLLWWRDYQKFYTLCHRVYKNKSIDLYQYKWIYQK